MTSTLSRQEAGCAPAWPKDVKDNDCIDVLVPAFTGDKHRHDVDGSQRKQQRKTHQWIGVNPIAHANANTFCEGLEPSASVLSVKSTRIRMARHTQGATKRSGRICKRPGTSTRSAYVYAVLGWYCPLCRQRQKWADEQPPDVTARYETVLKRQFTASGTPTCAVVASAADGTPSLNSSEQPPCLYPGIAG